MNRATLVTTTILCNLVTGFAIGVLKFGINTTTSQYHRNSNTSTQYHPFVSYVALSFSTSSNDTMEQYNSQLHQEILMVSPCCTRRTFALLLMDDNYLLNQSSYGLYGYLWNQPSYRLDGHRYLSYPILPLLIEFVYLRTNSFPLLMASTYLRTHSFQVLKDLIYLWKP